MHLLMIEHIVTRLFLGLILVNCRIGSQVVRDVCLNCLLNVSSLDFTFFSSARTRQSILLEALVATSNRSSFIRQHHSGPICHSSASFTYENSKIVEFIMTRRKPSYDYNAHILFLTSLAYDEQLLTKLMTEAKQNNLINLKASHMKVDTYNIVSVQYFLFHLTAHAIRFVVLMLNEEEVSLVFEMTKTLTFDESVWFTYLRFEKNFGQNHFIKLVNKYELYTTETLSMLSSSHTANSTPVVLNNSHSESIVVCASVKSKHRWRVATVFDRPFLVEIPKDDERDPCPENSVTCIVTTSNMTARKCCSGLALEIFQLVAEDLGVEFDLYIVKDGYYGSMDENGTWNGIINDVMQRRADIGIQALTITELRSRAVDFTEHFMESSVAITLRQSMLSELPTLNLEFASIIDTQLAIVFMAGFFLLTVMVHVVENLARFASKTKYYTCKEAFSYISSLTFQRDLGAENPRKWSARVIALVHAGGLTIFMTSYTAILTANHMLGNNAYQFKGLFDPLITDPASNFVLGVKKGTNIAQFLQTIDKLSSVKVNLLTGSGTGMEGVYAGSLDGYVDDYIYSLYRISDTKYCSTLMVYKDHTAQNSVAFVVPKNSSLKNLISSSILELKADVKLDTIIDKWYYHNDCAEKNSLAYKYPWNYASGLLVVLSSFCALCVVILLKEWFLERKKLANKTKNQQKIYAHDETSI